MILLEDDKSSSGWASPEAAGILPRYFARISSLLSTVASPYSRYEIRFGILSLQRSNGERQTCSSDNNCSGNWASSGGLESSPGLPLEPINEADGPPGTFRFRPILGSFQLLKKLVSRFLFFEPLGRCKK
jgi:hypothetical protein